MRKYDMKKNVLLLSMSTLGRDIENYYYRKGRILSGRCSMEPGTKYIISKLAEKNEELSKIIVLCSPEASENEKFFDGKKTTAYEYYIEKIKSYIHGTEKNFQSLDEIAEYTKYKDGDIQVELLISIVKEISFDVPMDSAEMAEILKNLSEKIFDRYEDEKNSYEKEISLDDVQLELNDMLRERLKSMLDVKEISNDEIEKYAELYINSKVTKGDETDYELLKQPEFRIKLLAESYAQRAFELREDIVIVKKMFEKIAQLQSKLDTLRSKTKENVRQCIKQCLIFRLHERLEQNGTLKEISLKGINEPEFVPIKISSVNTNMSNYAIIPTLVEEITSGSSVEDRVYLYMDTQGGARTTNLIINAVVDMLRTTNVELCASYATAFEVSNIINNIDDVSMSNRVFDLVSGMDEFLNYGKANKFGQYYDFYKKKKKVDIKDSIPEDKVVETIGRLSEAISLCQINTFYRELKTFKGVIDEYDKTIKTKDALFEGFIGNIKKSYEVIWNDDCSVFDVIDWCIERQLYQQALTICESKFPEQMMKDGVFYYATEKSKSNKIKELKSIIEKKIKEKKQNELYRFENLIHYHVKYYRYDIERSDNKSEKWYEVAFRNKKIFSNYIDEKNYNEFNNLLIEYKKVCDSRNPINHSDDSNSANELNSGTIINVLSNLKQAYTKIINSTQKKNGEPIEISCEEINSMNKNRRDKKNKNNNKNGGPLTQKLNISKEFLNM